MKIKHTIFIEDKKSKEQFKIELVDVEDPVMDVVLDQLLKLKPFKYISDKEFDYSDKMVVELTHPDDDDCTNPRIIGRYTTKELTE